MDRTILTAHGCRRRLVLTANKASHASGVLTSPRPPRSVASRPRGDSGFPEAAPRLAGLACDVRPRRA